MSIASTGTKVLLVLTLGLLAMPIQAGSEDREAVYTKLKSMS